jgi:pimeloyl-ACP methyl ester carboxylesterase
MGMGEGMRVRSRGLRRVGIAVTVALAVVAGGQAGTATGQASDAGGVAAARVPALEWAPCGPERPGRECAVATVPVDHDHPGGPTTEVALARIPAADQANRIGSLFVNPGGPGASGVGFVSSALGEQLSTQVGSRFDIVGFDPRGVGASDPLHCFESEEARDEYLASVPVFPYRPEQYRPFFETARGLEQRCLDEDQDGEDDDRDDQAIAAHMSTADVARDLDLLRQAVGDPGLTYLGFSYGSYLGNTYANLFPRRVRALAIDGVVDPRLWSSGWQVSTDRIAMQDELDEFVRLCDEAGSGCAFSAPGGSQARWEALADAVRARPIELPGVGPVTYDLLIETVAAGLAEPEVWGGPEGLAADLDRLADAVRGAQNAAADAAAIHRSLVDRLTGPADEADEVDEADYSNGFDASYGNHCADAQYPSSFRDFRAIDRYAAAGSRFGPWAWWLNAGCADWPVNADRYVGPWTARTSAPVLVVGNHFDGVTGYAGARASARLLPNSRLLSYAGWGHTAYFRSDCTRQHVDAYLLEGSLPPAGTVCPANPNPFAPDRRADRQWANQPVGPGGVPLVSRGA